MDLEASLSGSFLSVKDREEIGQKCGITPLAMRTNGLPTSQSVRSFSAMLTLKPSAAVNLWSVRLVSYT